MQHAVHIQLPRAARGVHGCPWHMQFLETAAPGGESCAMDHFRFKLYVAGQSARSRSAIRNLNRICETVLYSRCDVQIVEVLAQPQIA